MARVGLRSLRNEDYTDRELLHILNDEGKNTPGGWVTTHDLVSVLGVTHPDPQAKPEERAQHASRCVGSRYAYMTRVGLVERDDERKHWRISAIGHDLMGGRLTKGVENALAKMKPADRILVMRHLTNGYERAAAAGVMLRREWQHGIARNGRN